MSFLVSLLVVYWYNYVAIFLFSLYIINVIFINYKFANKLIKLNFNEIIKNNKGNMQALFKIANTIFDKNCSSHTLPQYNNAKSLADQFNSFYNDKVHKIRKQIPQTSFDRQKYSKSFNGVALSSFRPTSVAELSEILKSSGIKTSFHDILPAHLLKKVLDLLLPYFFWGPNFVNWISGRFETL